MDKRYEETKLQVLLSPALLVAKDQYQVLIAGVSFLSHHTVVLGLFSLLHVCLR